MIFKFVVSFPIIIFEQPPDKWEETLKKINFNPINDQFYNEYPIKPGFHFYKNLIEAKIPLKYLKGVNIPDFIINLQSDTYMVYQGKINLI